MTDDDYDLTIPHEWDPRPYQLEALQAFDSGIRRMLLVWHRQSGKDNFAANLIARETVNKKGVYWIVYPTQKMARQDVWLKIDDDGQNMIDHVFPKQYCQRKLDQEMLIETITGSIVQLIGADKDKNVGASPIGIVFSEWDLCDPSTWDYLRPIIRRNKGWVVFITTYRGKKQAYKMMTTLKNNPDWYCDIKTVNDTFNGDGTPVLSKDDIDAERREGMSEALIQQEYYCSPMAALQGAYFTKEMAAMEAEHRLTTIAYDPSLPVYATFDLGHSGRGDATVAAFIQDTFNTPRIIYSQGWRQHSITEVVDDIKKLPWASNCHLLLPHDGNSAESGTGKTRLEMYREQHDWKSCEVVERCKNIQDDIELLRKMLPATRIDNSVDTSGVVNNFVLTEALSGYRAKETMTGIYSDTPIHSWESDWVACLRTYSNWRNKHGDKIKTKKVKALDYSRLNRAAFGTP